MPDASQGSPSEIALGALDIDTLIDILAEVLAGAPQSHIPAPCRGLAPRLAFPGLRPDCVGVMQGMLGLKDALS